MKGGGLIVSPSEGESRSAGQRRPPPRFFEREKRLLAPLGGRGIPGRARRVAPGRRRRDGVGGVRAVFCLGTKCAGLRPGAATLRCPVTEPGAGAAGGGWGGRGRENPRAERSCRCRRPAGGGFCVLGGSFFCARASATVAPRCGVWAAAPGVTVGRSPVLGGGDGEVDAFPPALGFVESLGGLLVAPVSFHPLSLRFF